MSSKAREKYIILLLGSDPKSLPSELHAQKELFTLSKVNPKINHFFNFESHYKGPYSQLLSEHIKEPQYYPDAYTVDSEGIHLTNSGKKEFQKLIHENKNDEKFLILKYATELTRKIYDQLSDDELLLLIYKTYPEFIDRSSEYQKIIERLKDKKQQIFDQFHEKNIVTEERYKELLTLVE